ncbi:hypothetical protein F0562_002277 [Nyssa sinensis]|uniref:TF-B3 domain-containing protein n=1 Tax=Nyssa sinensis TaxID=561372 RepID=A0A5J5C5C4_9ASTE|nr:hypothetical protein F0562_002277 [Nyssa sinensis]
MKMTLRTRANQNVITNGWNKFVKKHNLGAKDDVHFYKPNLQPKEGNLFLLKYSRATDDRSNGFRNADIRQAELLFEKKLTRSHVNSIHVNGLAIPQKYRDHFPALETTNEGGTSEWNQIYCFDDREKREREMTVRPHEMTAVIKDKNDRDEDGSTVGGSTEQGVDDDDSTVWGNIEQGDDEDDRTDGDSSEQGEDEDDSTDKDSNDEDDDEEDDNADEDSSEHDDDEDENTDDKGKPNKS